INSSLKWLEDAIEKKLVNFFKYSGFNVCRKISDSRTSSVFESEWVNFGLTVALKSLKVENDGNDICSFVKELKLLQRVSYHPKIIHFFGVTQ
ncbi:7310_t:CDS:2, partial [Dentiscutata heterogama]